MNESKKPRIAEILGVEVGERFSVEGQRGGDPLYIGEDGLVRYVSDDGVSASAIQIAINHPDRIIRKPRWTEQDRMDAHTIKAILLEASRVTIARLPSGAVKLSESGRCVFLDLNCNLFPSLKPGESATLDEIIGGGE